MAARVVVVADEAKAVRADRGRGLEPHVGAAVERRERRRAGTQALDRGTGEALLALGSRLAGRARLTGIALRARLPGGAGRPGWAGKALRPLVAFECGDRLLVEVDLLQRPVDHLGAPSSPRRQVHPGWSRFRHERRARRPAAHLMGAVPEDLGLLALAQREPDLGTGSEFRARLRLLREHAALLDLGREGSRHLADRAVRTLDRKLGGAERLALQLGNDAEGVEAGSCGD